MSARAGRRNGQTWRQEHGSESAAMSETARRTSAAARARRSAGQRDGRSGGECDSGERGGATDEGGGGERDGGERGGAVDERRGDGAAAMNALSPGVSVVARWRLVVGSALGCVLYVRP